MKTVCFCLTNIVDKKEMINISAEVVKLVDAVDSKSTGLLVRAGSIPAFGTILFEENIRHFAIRQVSMIFLWRFVLNALYYKDGLANLSSAFAGIFFEPCCNKYNQTFLEV